MLRITVQEPRHDHSCWKFPEGMVGRDGEAGDGDEEAPTSIYKISKSQG